MRTSSIRNIVSSFLSKTFKLYQTVALDSRFRGTPSGKPSLLAISADWSFPRTAGWKRLIISGSIAVRVSMDTAGKKIPRHRARDPSFEKSAGFEFYLINPPDLFSQKVSPCEVEWDGHRSDKLFTRPRCRLAEFRRILCANATRREQSWGSYNCGTCLGDRRSCEPSRGPSSFSPVCHFVRKFNS